VIEVATRRAMIDSGHRASYFW